GVDGARLLLHPRPPRNSAAQEPRLRAPDDKGHQCRPRDDRPGTRRARNRPERPRDDRRPVVAWSQGVDLSQFNSVYDWTRVWTSLDFVVHRTTIGQYTLDAMFDARLEHLRGRLWGAYHVLTPGADPAAQARSEE